MLLSPIEAPAEAPSERVDAASFILSLRARGIRDTAVLSAMERVRRDLFAPRRFADLARTDVSLPLPFGQTMTAPSAVATMLVALGAEPNQRVLEIGTGSGYVTALLARIGCRVTTIGRYATLAEEAQVRLEVAGADPAIEMGVGNGLVIDLGGERFERILVNGAVASVPSALTSLLAAGGRLVGGLAVEGFPRLVTIERGEEGGLAQALGPALRLARLIGGRGALKAAA
ncbi:MAG TPA: protein-L-isoaspartate O-methyltransferase [Beijerinckiaceae bacterium]|nr:protein-L-isoaspartate O-methyltransferase [Beijerinckiaceae bacterium]